MQLTYVRYVDLAYHAGAIDLPDDIGCIIGVPRSGMLPATMLATRAHLPLGMSGVNALSGGLRMSDTAAAGRKVLLVDDSILTGNSMKLAKESLMRLGVDEGRIVTCAFYAETNVLDTVDLFAAEVGIPRIFEWNIWNSRATNFLMVDMDGVLCFDPPVFDNDGEEYENALKTARPKFIPHYFPVHSIVTNRIDRWRGVTEEWLNAHGAQYGALVMQPFGTAAERRSRSNPAAYKVEHYRDSEAVLFVESHDAIAAAMSQMSPKPVLSVQSNRIFQQGVAA